MWLPSVCCCIVRDPLEESAALASVELVHPTRVFSSNTPSLLLVHNTLNKCTLDGLPPPSSNQCIVNRDPSSSTPRPNIFQEKIRFSTKPVPLPSSSETSQHFRNIFRFSKFGNVEQGNKKWDYPRKTGIRGGATIYVFGFPTEKVEFLKTLPKVCNAIQNLDFFPIAFDQDEVVILGRRLRQLSHFLQR